MAVTKTLSNKFFLELGKGMIDFSTDSFFVILMDDTYAFNRDTHALYSDISASELSTGNGYTVADYTLTASSAWAQDNTGDKGAIVWEHATWTVSTGSIGPTGAAVILQTNSTLADSVIVGCIDFGENVTVTDGVSFQLQNLGFDLSQAA